MTILVVRVERRRAPRSSPSSAAACRPRRARREHRPRRPRRPACPGLATSTARTKPSGFKRAALLRTSAGASLPPATSSSFEVATMTAPDSASRPAVAHRTPVRFSASSTRTGGGLLRLGNALSPRHQRRGREVDLAGIRHRAGAHEQQCVANASHGFAQVPEEDCAVEATPRGYPPGDPNDSPVRGSPSTAFGSPARGKGDGRGAATNRGEFTRRGVDPTLARHSPRPALFFVGSTNL